MIEFKTLDCGIRIVMEKIPYVQSASVGIWVRAASVDETEENAGISHFIEHMMFKGTQTRTAKQIAWDADKIGGHINAFTGKEATCYYLKTLDSNLKKGCDILIDMLLNSQFDPAEMEKERMVILEEMKMIEDSPDELAQDLLTEAVFKGTDLESPIIGTPTSLKSIERAQLKQYIAKEYTRDSLVISLAGNFDEAVMCSFFEGRLRTLTEKKAEKNSPLATYDPTYLVKRKDVEQSHICLGVKGVKLEDPLYYALALLNNALGGSMSSRLFQNIREEKGLAYSVYSSAAAYVKQGIFSIYAGVGNDKVEDTILAISEELSLLKKNGITEEELSTAREQLKSNYIFGLESVNSRMFSIGKHALLLDRVRTSQEIISAIDAVNMADIEKATDLVCHIQDYSGVLVGKSKVDLGKIMEKC